MTFFFSPNMQFDRLPGPAALLQAEPPAAPTPVTHGASGCLGYRAAVPASTKQAAGSLSLNDPFLRRSIGFHINFTSEQFNRPEVEMVFPTLTECIKTRNLSQNQNPKGTPTFSISVLKTF